MNGGRGKWGLKGTFEIPQWLSRSLVYAPITETKKTTCLIVSDVCHGRSRMSSNKSVYADAQFSVSLVAMFRLLIASLVLSLLSVDAAVRFEDGGYTNLMVAIHPSIPEDPNIVEAIQAMLTSASSYLYGATRKAAYFRDVSIVLPPSWRMEGEPVSGDMFLKAEVRVDRPNPAYNDTPYTLQPGECGEPGQYIHFTPTFLTSTAIKKPDLVGRLFVHEWGHLRYGVFDEYGTPGSERYPAFYVHNGRVLPSVCMDSIVGNAQSMLDGGPCSFIEDRIDDDCVFIPSAEETTSKASIMYSYQLPSIEGFCDDDTDERKHNVRAPTKHNVLCGYKSTWQVIRSHPDFNRGDNGVSDFRPSVDDFDTAPQFRLLKMPQANGGKFVLVLDVSQSMMGKPAKMLHRSAVRFISDRLPDGSSLGMVAFSTRPRILAPMTRLDDATRSSLSKMVPGQADSKGRTAIGKALVEAVQVLKTSGTAKGALILLITDGEENEYPLIDRVIPQLVREAVTVNTIAFGRQASVKLENLTKATGGKSFFFSLRRWDDPSTSLDSAFTESVTAQSDVELQPAEILQKTVRLERNEESFEVVIDKELGKNTVFAVSSNDIHELDMRVESPSRVHFDERSPEYTRDDFLGMKIAIKIPMAESGQWRITVEKSSPYSAVSFSLFVTSEARGEDDLAIRTRAWINETNVVYPNRVKIYAEVKKGYNAVVGARVMATVSRPDNQDIQILLKDDGDGADVTKDDGIYSAFFSDFVANGRYSVVASVVNDGRARLKVGSLSSSSSMNVMLTAKLARQSRSKPPASSFAFDEFIVVASREAHRPSTDQESQLVSVERFQRVADAGAFRLEKWRPSASDNISPGRILDLTVVKIDGPMIVLEWTNPGDDLHEGNASALELRASTSAEALVTSYKETLIIDESFLVDGTLLPAPAGVKQNLTLTLTNTTGDVYFAMRAWDEANNEGPLSNLASAHFDLLSYVSEEAARQSSQRDEHPWQLVVGLAVGLSFLLTIAILVIAGFVCTRKKYERVQTR